MPTDASASYAAEVARLLWPEPVGGAARHPQPARQRRRPPRRLRVPERAPPAAAGPGRPAGARRPCSDGWARAGPRSPARSAACSSAPSARAPSRWPGGRSCGSPATDPGADSIETPPRRLPRHRRPRRRPPRHPPGQPEAGAPGLRPRRAVLGYAKVGHNDLTAALVRREADVPGRRRQPRARAPSSSRGAAPRPVGRPRGPGDLAAARPTRGAR